MLGGARGAGAVEVAARAPRLPAPARRRSRRRRCRDGAARRPRARRRPRPRDGPTRRAEAGGDGQAGGLQASAGAVLSSSADGVVVRRNVVINVGGGAAAGQRTTPGAARRRRPAHASTRGRPQAPVAASDGGVVAGQGRARAASPPEPRLSRWPRRATSACPGRRPARSALSQPVAAAATSQPPRSAPAARPPERCGCPGIRRRRAGREDASRGELGADKSLDEVILEYLVRRRRGRRALIVASHRRAERQSIRATTPASPSTRT